MVEEQEKVIKRDEDKNCGISGGINSLTGFEIFEGPNISDGIDILEGFDITVRKCTYIIDLADGATVSQSKRRLLFTQFDDLLLETSPRL